MGAWGYSLFANDLDQDIPGDFDAEAGLPDLEEEAIKAAKAAGKKVRDYYDFEPKKDDEVHFHYTVYAPACTDAEFVRKHLDSGVLDEILANKDAAIKRGEILGIPDPTYAYVLLCACAMTLGCKLRSNVRQRLKELVPKVERLPPDADEQLEKALIGPEIYKSGEPYEFVSPGPYEIRENETPKKPTPGGYIMMNVPAQYGFGVMPKRFTPRQVEDKTLTARGAFGDNRCASCGDKEPEVGDDLMVCGKCKGSRYCSKACQKAHWTLHKKVCKVQKSNVDVVMGGVHEAGDA